MKSELKNRMKRNGIDVDGVLDRLAGNEDFYEYLLMQFQLEDRMKSIEMSFMIRDYVSMEMATQNLESVASNLGFTRVLKSTAKLNQLLMKKRYDDLDESFMRVKADYEHLMDFLSENFVDQRVVVMI